MLQNLHVKNLALIDEVEVDFRPGLNILTGETGAGKSIILGSVGLALGGRYHRDLVRQGAPYGLVELTFGNFTDEETGRLKMLEIFPEEGMVVLSRRLMEGRSVSRINGETVNMTTLREAAKILIDVHGQHEHQMLFHKKNQLEILDTFAGAELLPVAQRVRTAYGAYKDCLTKLTEARLDEAERAKEIAFLEFEVKEITEANLSPGEDEHLEASYRRMNHAKSIVEDAAEAYEYTGGAAESASQLISRAIRCMSNASKYDQEADQLYRQLMEVDGLLNDFNRELSDYQETLEFSEEEYHETQERLNEINRLKTKYGPTIDEIQAYCKEKQTRLQKLEDYDSYLTALQEEAGKREESLKECTVQLSAIRREKGRRFAEAICKELKDLNSSDVKFEISFEELSDYTANGRDDVEFLISMNPGEPVKPLNQVASGGELSRTMLAVKTVMADKDDIATLIFDEIDAGISGRTAQKVSEKMAVIGRNRQVICITHLAQIAAMADAHYVIEKTVEDLRTRTGIRPLDEGQAVEELARILGGTEITDTVRKSASEMKSLAKKAKHNLFQK